MADNDSPGAWPIWGMVGRIYKGNFKKNCYTQNIKALGLMVPEKKLYLCGPMVSQWQLSVAMGTRVPIRSGPKPYAAFPSPQ